MHLTLVLQCITEVNTMSISFRVSPEEELQIRNYAQFKGVSLSTLIKEAVFDQMETELDIMIFESIKKNPSSEPSISLEELKRILDIK
jgi:predicted DNA-binding protein